MAMMVAHEDMRVMTNKGHIVVFKAGEPTSVPEAVEMDCMLQGVRPYTGKVSEISKTAIEAEAEGIIAKLTGEEIEIEVADDDEIVLPEPPPRAQAIKRALSKLLEEGKNEENFTPTGWPKSAAVKRVSGIDGLTWREIRLVYKTQFMQE